MPKKQSTAARKARVVARSGGVYTRALNLARSVPPARPATPTSLPLDFLLKEFTNGDETSWEEERAFLEAEHPLRLARITKEIRSGFFPPVRVCFDERRVMDGHHRIICAWRDDMAEIPVADAWDGTKWWKYDDPADGDDPEPEREAL